MKGAADDLEKIIGKYQKEFYNLHEKVASICLADDKWSLKEIIGHLVDSASNNHQRFVRLQFKEELNFPDYDKDKWLAIQNYSSMTFSEISQLFVSYNILISHIISLISKECLENYWNFEWKGKSSISLQDLVIHYVEHLETHLEQFQHRKREVLESCDSLTSL